MRRAECVWSDSHTRVGVVMTGADRKLRGGGAKLELHARAEPWLALDSDASAMQHHDAARDRKAQPHASACGRADLIGAIEAIEDVHLSVDGNSLPRVDHIDGHHAARR